MSDARAERAYTDVVAVERVAPGMVRVVTWSDAYMVDARDGGCLCPDKQYNDPTRCKHEHAAVVADTGLPTPFTVAEDLGSRVMTDGGQVEPEHSGNTPKGHDEWTCYDPDRDNLKVFDSRQAAEERQDEMRGLADLEVYAPGESPEAMYHGKGDSDIVEPEDVGVPKGEGESIAEASNRVAEVNDSSNVQADVVDHTADTVTVDDPDPEPVDVSPEAPGPEDLPERSVSDDPISWIPSEFVDQIDGSQAINRKGFEVLSHFYDVSTTAELQVKPEETDHEYCRVKATATIDDRTVQAFGSAHVDRGDDATLLLEMADTRARKRALSIATGVGAVAVSELKNEVDQ